ncbi:MAG TPA: hypothetical protein VKA08_07310 [Balneolales bacterium]|nr:hypothetical protein [Balneolales bacterium]
MSFSSITPTSRHSVRKMSVNSIFSWMPVILGIGLLAGCSKKPQYKSAYVYGNVTVSTKIDSSGDYSGINLTVVEPDTSNKVDTLFHAVTNRLGQFSGTAKFKSKGIYPLILNRNSTDISSSAVILAANDSLKIVGQLPDFGTTVKYTSHEEKAYSTYERLEGDWARLMAYARNGQVKQDTLPKLAHTWSNLFWSVYQKYPGTIAAQHSAVTTIRILEGWDDSLAFARFKQIKDPAIQTELSRDLVQILASRRGLNRALVYVDSLSQASDNQNLKIALGMSKVKILYDSTKIQEARDDLMTFKKAFASANDQARSFAQSMQYDLDSLAPGMPMPSFRVVTLSGDTLTNNSFKGHPYVMEITGLANKLYQNQYDDMNAVYLVYRYFGLKFLTVPIDTSEITVKAFFDDRARNWPFARAGSYKMSNLLHRLNIQLIPTRFLVDSKGDIVRKYVGTESQYLLQGLSKVFHKTEKKS